MPSESLFSKESLSFSPIQVGSFFAGVFQVLRGVDSLVRFFPLADLPTLFFPAQ